MAENKPGFYAVRIGRIPGVYMTWEECKTQVNGFPDGEHRKFSTLEEANSFISGRPVGLEEEMHDEDIDDADPTESDTVYIKGVCKGNGKEGSVAGFGVWWAPGDSRNTAQRCPGEQTNNRAELLAILYVLETAPMTQKPLIIKTGSQYPIQCFKLWIHGWRENKWKTSSGSPVKNATIIRCISQYLRIREASGQPVFLEDGNADNGHIRSDGVIGLANRGTRLAIATEPDWNAVEAHLNLNSVLPED